MASVIVLLDIVAFPVTSLFTRRDSASIRVSQAKNGKLQALQVNVLVVSGSEVEEGLPRQ